MTPPDGVYTDSHPDTQNGLAIGAAVVTILLTGAAFWLSYEHLHDVAADNGLSDSTRAWTWPATVDLFIISGELLILRASLMQRGMDWWAVALAGTGSIGSIALNVAGVGTDAGLMEYVVAAVPPTAALLAFGALMRQVHQALLSRQQAVSAPVISTGATMEAPNIAKSEEAAHSTVDEPEELEKPEPVKEPEKPSEPLTQPQQIDAVIRALYDELGQRRPTTALMTDALKKAGLPSSDGTARESRKRVEAAEPRLKTLPSALAA
ncbi:DUF2637 domain-containing protein [Streptomyces apricus]|uniref:DUF2637 domain-containing protein n=1 Tax=Streptomyces apricus TaxID=1828112 RepID=A0A5B0A6M9_9ACTN|nr:DUF2637 domain-containing protein [Streptomyces apricus]KAA0924265.1 DUF2637 domain-containing protein [Streptomyces apricus]